MQRHPRIRAHAFLIAGAAGTGTAESNSASPVCAAHSSMGREGPLWLGVGAAPHVVGLGFPLSTSHFPPRSTIPIALCQFLSLVHPARAYLLNGRECAPQRGALVRAGYHWVETIE